MHKLLILVFVSSVIDKIAYLWYNNLNINTFRMRGGIIMEEKKIVLTGKEFSGMYVDEKNEKAFTVQECNCCQTCKA